MTKKELRAVIDQLILDRDLENPGDRDWINYLAKMGYRGWLQNEIAIIREKKGEYNKLIASLIRCYNALN